MEDGGIEFKSKFKSVNLFNQTLHIILYPEDGLKTASRLSDLEEGKEITILIKP